MSNLTLLSNHEKLEGSRMKHIVGLDIETTGSQLDSSRTLQVAIALGSKVYCRDVGNYHPKFLWPHDDGGPDWTRSYWRVDPDALKVNHWTKERYEAAQDHSEVDLILSDRLQHDEGFSPKSLIAVGWNVAGFDMPFVRRDLPRIASFFHYRTIDLNACVFMLTGGGRPYDELKARLKELAATALGRSDWHDAGFDAAAALTVFKILRKNYGLRDDSNIPTQ